MELYYQALAAPSVAEFDRVRKLLEQCWPKGSDYLDRNWWIYKEKMVSAWTNKFVHFGQTATSRVEASHAKMKAWLENGRADIYSFITKLIPWWLQMFDTIEQSKLEERLKIPFRYQDPLYANVLHIVCKYALGLVYKQLQSALEQDKEQQTNEEAKECSGISSFTKGYPCIHRVRELKATGRSLQPSDFHIHWWIDRSQPLQEKDKPILEFKVKTRSKFTRVGATRKGMGKTGTIREELVSEKLNQNSKVNKSKRRRLEIIQRISHRTKALEEEALQEEALQEQYCPLSSSQTNAVLPQTPVQSLPQQPPQQPPQQIPHQIPHQIPQQPPHQIPQQPPQQPPYQIPGFLSSTTNRDHQLQYMPKFDSPQTNNIYSQQPNYYLSSFTTNARQQLGSHPLSNAPSRLSSYAGHTSLETNYSHSQSHSQSYS